MQRAVRCRRAMPNLNIIIPFSRLKHYFQRPSISCPAISCPAFLMVPSLSAPPAGYGDRKGGVKTVSLLNG